MMSCVLKTFKGHLIRISKKVIAIEIHFNDRAACATVTLRLYYTARGIN